MSALRETLGSLHDVLADALVDAIKNGVQSTSIGDDGKEVITTKSCGAAVLNVARAFLRDNGIETDPESPSKSVKDLTATLAATADLDDFPDFPDTPNQ